MEPPRLAGAPDTPSTRPRLASALARVGARLLEKPGKRAAAEFLSRVREAPAGRLERVDGFVARAIVLAVFRAAPMQLNRRAVHNLEAAIEWRITEADGGASMHTMLISGGRCRVKTGPVAEPDLVIELALADFLRLVAGQADGVQLFATGQLKLRGDPSIALRLPRVFRIPARRGTSSE
ncbi:MAG: SCP2 sterol-binding domain-containing protein [Solirubrobacteraceae bacterium]